MNETGEETCQTVALPILMVGAIICHKESRNVLLLHRHKEFELPGTDAGTWGFLKSGLAAGESTFLRLDGLAKVLFKVPTPLADMKLLDVVEVLDKDNTSKHQLCTYYMLQASSKFEADMGRIPFDEIRWTHVDNIRTMLDGTGTNWDSGVKEMLLKNYNKIFDYIIRIRK